MLHVGDVVQVAISIHSLLAEGDAQAAVQAGFTRHFNPLPPRGGRRHRHVHGRRTDHFNPLPPRGGRLASSPSAAMA